ncbi:ankyrin repeat domain-containing protein 2-like [Microplitis mediator]|uniref:ankyrin repeat domain-containing protein 2-like n=1 Tax=Microplitis mediator TaxID=375433 RepID=UPI0025527904|nr:ankyrin repeat domain-containing protein 2-like [Microplitis mediator]
MTPRMGRRKFRYLIRAIESQDEEYINKLKPENLHINEARPILGNPLHKAARVGNYRIFKKLIELGADINLRLSATGTPILHSAMISCNYDIVKYLIEHGVDVNAMSKNHVSGIVETALHLA